MDYALNQSRMAHQVMSMFNEVLFKGFFNKDLLMPAMLSSHKHLVQNHDSSYQPYYEDQYSNNNVSGQGSVSYGDNSASGSFSMNVDSAAMEEAMNWIMIIFVVIFAYLILMFVGIIAFPPFVICLTTTGGDLKTCSFEIWQ